MNHRKLAFGTMSLMAVNVVKSIGMFLLLPVMAKLVGPQEYGLYSIALPAVMFVMVIADGGLGMSLAREKDDASPVWSTAFYALVLAAIGLSLLLILYSWLVAGTGRLLAITAVLSLSLIFSGTAVVPSARMVRDGEMPYLAAIDIVSFIVGASTSVGMALAGFGVWSLVAQIVGAALTRSLIINIISPTRLRGAFAPALLKPHLALGGAIGLARLSDFGGRMGEMYIVNRTSSSAFTGVFGFGNQVGKFACELVNNQIWALMYIISLNASKDDLRLYYFRLTRVISILVLPIAALTAASAGELIALTMGHEWDLAGPLISFYTPAFAIACIASIGSAMMYARGTAALPLALNISLVALRLVAIAALPIAGWQMMIYLLAAGNIVNSIAAFWLIERRYKWGIGALMLWLLKPIVAATAGGATLYLTLQHLPASLWSIALAASLGGLVYCALLFATDHKQITADIRDFYRLLKNKKSGALPSEALG